METVYRLLPEILHEMTRIKFKINGVEHSVGSEYTSDVSLLDYVRGTAELRGTKYNCLEAGCGACIVTAVRNAGDTPSAVNACMVNVLQCQNWEITTIEKVGNKLDGYSTLQKTLAESHGTQCGYCSPGFIMAMYSLLQKKQKPTMDEIEKALGSNICRCTGYRPILDAFKKFAIDAPNSVRIRDLEDLCCGNSRGCGKNNSCSEDWCLVSAKGSEATSVIEIPLADNKKWFKVETVADAVNILNEHGTSSYMFVAGNTAKGAIPQMEYPDVMIDISTVPEIRGITLDQNLIIGSGTTLTEMLEMFVARSGDTNSFGYLKDFNEHFSLVAHNPVRNVGTIGGNLMMKHKYNEFASDVFLLFETVGAEVTIYDSKHEETTVDMQTFLKTDMTGKILTKIILPPLSTAHSIVTYKVMSRAQGAHAIVNAGFMFKLTSEYQVEECRIVYGGLSAEFIRATKAESHIVGKELFTNELIQDVIAILDTELVVVENPPEPSANFRKQLAINLFYKSLLKLCPSNKVNSIYKSGATKVKISRPISSGSQVYDTDSSLWPLNQPIEKLEALSQCSGEAVYTDDLPAQPREVFAAFVLSTIPVGKIASIDAKRALELTGVIAFYTANDIPGLNSFTPAGTPFYAKNEEVLCSGEVKYHFQPIGIIVAETKVIAERAATMVDVTYSNLKTPVLDIKDAKKDTSKLTLFKSVEATERGSDIAKVITSDNTIYGQYHFPMETVACVTRPTADGMDVLASTQWMDIIQLMISSALNVDENAIDVTIPRVGGAFGLKISRTAQVAVACALVTHKLNRPCRFVTPLTTNLKVFGKRGPCSTDFEVGVDSKGVIQYLNTNLYGDNGFDINEALSTFGVDVYNNAYDAKRWNYKCYDAITDTAKNTWCRSPGTLENIANSEMIMEQIAYELGLDPLEVRVANVDTTKYAAVKELVQTLKSDAQYIERRAAVDKFNAANRWIKRGLRFSLLRWTPIGSTYLSITLNVFHGDGSISITHGGIEMGQGINTKAAQICAYFLKVPVSKIKIKPNTSTLTPNNFASGGSFSSQYVGMGIEKACKALLAKLEPIRAEMGEPTWEELVAKAKASDIDLRTTAFVGAADMFNMDIFGATLAEVEVDILTGEFEVLRVDLLQDVGQSVSPKVDIGQVEGAFIMGLGYWTCEHLEYDKNTGEILTNRAWTYHVPQARDIPQDFRIYLRKNSYSDVKVLGSKMTGEPSICMSIVIPFAIREAIAAARADAGIPTTTWFHIDGAYSLEKICMNAATPTNAFKLN